jgi:hypothetical protein
MSVIGALMPSLFNVPLHVRRLRPAVLKSKLLKPFSAGKLQQDQVAGKIKKTADDTNSSANRDIQKNPYQTLSCAVNNGDDTSTQSGDNTDGSQKGL